MQRKASDGVPTVEVSLAPPTKPLPGVASEIGSLDAAREKAEAGKMSEVTAAFNAALRSAAGKIGKAFGLRAESTALSMLQEGVVSFKVTVIPGAEPDSAVTSKISALESKRTDMATKMFDVAAAEFEGITSAVVAALKKELAASKSRVALRGAPAFIQLPEEAPFFCCAHLL